MSVSGYYETSYPPSLWEPPVIPAPTLTSLNPNTGVISTQVTVTLTGTGFLNGAVAVVSGAGDLPATYVNSTTLQVTVNLPASAGPIAIRVRNPDGQTTAQVGFTVTATGVQGASSPVDSPVVPQDSPEAPDSTGTAQEPPEAPEAS